MQENFRLFAQWFLAAAWAGMLFLPAPHAVGQANAVSPPVADTDRRKLAAPTANTWEQASHTRFPHGARIQTTADLQQWHKCNVQSFDTDRIVCKRAFGQTEVFARENVQSVYLHAPHRIEWAGTLIPAALAGGNVYWMVLLAGAGPLGIAAMVPVGAFAVMWGLLTAGAVIDESDGSKEIYRRPTQLAVAEVLK